jgi:hypothetical protein
VTAEEPVDRHAWLLRLEAAGTLLVQDLTAGEHQTLLPDAEAFLSRIVAEREEIERTPPG